MAIMSGPAHLLERQTFQEINKVLVPFFHRKIRIGRSTVEWEELPLGNVGIIADKACRPNSLTDRHIGIADRTRISIGVGR
jgi:hypothetical protein